MKVHGKGVICPQGNTRRASNDDSCGTVESPRDADDGGYVSVDRCCQRSLSLWLAEAFWKSICNECHYSVIA